MATSTKFKFTKLMKCVQVNKTTGRSSITLATDIVPEPATGKMTARDAVTIQLSNPKEAEGFEPGKDYTIQISE